MAESIVKIKLQADTTGLSQLDSIFATTGSKFAALTKIQELANSLSLERGRLEKINVSILVDQSKQLEAIKNSVANVKLKEILSNQVLKDNKANLDALAGSISNVSNKLKELELSKKQFTAIDATKVQAIKPQPFSLGLSTTAQQYKEILETQKRIQQENDKIPPKLKPWANSLSELIIRYRAINFVYNQFLNALYNIPKVGIQLESTTASLTATFGSAVAAGRELQFLTQESLRTGIAVGTLREQYANASASFIAAGESAETTRKIFQNVNTVATTLHLSSDRVSSVYLALSQIFNKTKLQAEELTKQLSQTIPGVTNQQAKALGITVSDLYDRMKKGAISAHEAVLALSETLGQTFGGDAFLVASKGLNAELGKLNTSWTLLSENLYKASQGILKEAVKDFINITNSLTNLTSNTREAEKAANLLVSVLAALATGGVILSLGMAFTKLKGYILASTAATNGFAAALTLVSKHPLITGLIVAGGFITFLYSQSKAADAAANSLKEYNHQLDIKYGIVKQTQEELFKQNLAENAAYKTAQDRLKEQELEVVRARKKALSNRKEDIDAKNEQIRLRDQLKTELINLEIQAQEEIKDKTQTVIFDASEARAKFEIAADRLAGNKVQSARKQFILSNAKELTELQQQLDDAAKAGNQVKIEEALKGFQDYQTALSKVGIKDTSAADLGKSANQAYRTDLQETKASFEQYKTDIASTLGVLDNLYQESQLSIEEYFNRKLALQKDDISVQRQMLESEKALAVAKGDTTKAAQLDYEIRKLNTQITKEEYENQTDLTKALKEYQQTMASAKSEYYTLIGKTTLGAEEEFNSKYAEQYAKAKANGKKEDIEILDALRVNTKFHAEMVDSATELNRLYKDNSRELNRINSLESSGVIGPIEAMQRRTEANEKELDIRKKIYTQQKLALEAAKASGKPYDKDEEDKIKDLGQAIEDLSLKSNEFAAYFQEAFGTGFANAFTEFATGAATAKEAFRDMALSISKDLAKMAAQEAATQLLTNVLKPLGGATWSGVTSLFAADGAAVAGMSSVSGSVLSSATYFPSAKPVAFASGGVVAGEAGAEAVLPLKRNKYGKLGVALENSGQSNSNVYNISVNVQSSANDTPSGTGEKVAVSIMRAIAKEEISSASRSGNFKAARSM